MTTCATSLRVTRPFRLSIVLTVAAVAVVGVNGPEAQAGPFTGPLSPADLAEVQGWGQRALTIIDTGQPAADAATFAFSVSAFNGPLFNPAIAAIRTVQQFGGVTIGLCNPEEEQSGLDGPMPGLVPLSNSPEGREYLQYGTITTNNLSQPLATIHHVEAIITAPVGSAVTISVDGNNLTSHGLPAAAANRGGGGGGNGGNVLYAAVSPATMAWLALLAGEAADLAAAQDLSRASLRPLNGQPAPVEALGRQIAAYAAGTLNRPLTTYPVYALFEDYGALPIVVCVYDDFSENTGNDRFFVLIDGVNGTMDGPFVSGGTIWPENLLATHPEADGTGPGEWVVVKGDGCAGPVAAGWNPTPPPGPGVFIPRPACPGCTPPALPAPLPPTPPAPHPVQWPPLDPTKPGWEGRICNQGASSCACNMSGQILPAAGPPIFYVKFCSCPGTCPPPAGFGGCSCTTRYFW